MIRCYMAHHSGMSLVALDQALLGRPMHRRFMAEREAQALSLLLHERMVPERAVVRIEERGLGHRDQGQARAAR